MSLISILTSTFLSSTSGILGAEINAIAETVVKQSFKNYLGLDTGNSPDIQDNVKNKAEIARQHITSASNIINEIRSELNIQAEQLDDLLEVIEVKKSDVAHYSTLAKTNQEASAALRKEMEKTLREELIKQANKNKYGRLAMSFLGWLLTLVLGAVLGAVVSVYYPKIEAYVKNLIE